MQETAERLLEDNYTQLEDVAMKAAAQYFGEELLAWIGEKEKPVRVAPTEIVHLEVRKMYEDFNFEMKNGWWYHFEFESDRITLADLKRFREYEAATSRTFGVPVVTCVVCSAQMKKVLSEFTEGLNTYRVKVIRMKKSLAEEVFEKIQKKKEVEREDLIPIILSPLMSGEMEIKKRILLGIKLVQKESSHLNSEEANKMQAVLYAFANKFLDDKGLKEVEEAIVMTRLGQMLLERGMREGKSEGIAEGIKEGIKEGITAGIKALTETCMELGVSREETLAKLKAKFQLDEQEAEEYLLKFWK